MDVSLPVSANAESLETNTINTISVTSVVATKLCQKYSSVLQYLCVLLHVLWLLSSSLLSLLVIKLSVKIILYLINAPIKWR